VQALVAAAWNYVSQHGKDKELFSTVRALLEAESRWWSRHGELLDYGTEQNLLETGTVGYQHVVPSPNAERALSSDRLADLADFSHQPGSQEWRTRAEHIRAAIRSELWDDRAGWFRCRRPNGHSELVYSTQVFQLLRTGICTQRMTRALLRHVRDGAFLGGYGVSSISAEDELHYEVGDPDWSGSGCYTGSGPLLAQALWEIEQPELAWDVYRRLLWMGQHLPYFPQEHYCDRPLAVAHKEANSISGLTGMEAILVGMTGIRPALDGSLRIQPQPPKGGSVEVTNYRFRDHCFDIQMNAGHCEVRRDGVTVYSGKPNRVCALTAR
jgi:hypothetical protein